MATIIAAKDNALPEVDPIGAEPIAATLPTIDPDLPSIASTEVKTSVEARLAGAVSVEPETQEIETAKTVANVSEPAPAVVQAAQAARPDIQTNEVQVLPTIVVSANKITQSAPEDPEARQMFYLLNAERRKKGLSAVSYDPEASLVAQTVASILERSLSTGGSSSVEKVEDLLLGAGVTYSVCAQTSVACDSVVTAHSSLLQVESHKTNLLSERFTRIGVAVLKAGPWGRICVELLLG
jgi:uncharacterized protein YkwD